MDTIRLPEKVQYIIGRLRADGFEAFAVGGCVRDSLLGRVPGDWDITTDAAPDQVKQCFPHTIDTGIEHGTVTVLLRHEGFEVTTYRIDGEYEDARHPKQVAFTRNLTEDLRRRDFTINAMAYSDETGLIDAFGGMRDLRQRLIRCVGRADDRFDEDALRIMRAVRFSAQLDFSIEPETLRSIAAHSENLRRISVERIRTELTKLLLSDYPERLLTAQELGLTRIFLPEFDRMLATEQENPHHIYNVGMHTIHALQYLAGREVPLPGGTEGEDSHTEEDNGAGKDSRTGEDISAGKDSRTGEDISTGEDSRTEENSRTEEDSPAAEAFKEPTADAGFQTSAPSSAAFAPHDAAEAQKLRTILRYAVLLHDVGKPEAKTMDKSGRAHFYRHAEIGAAKAAKILRRLKFDNETIGAVRHLIELHDYRYTAENKTVSERIVRRAISRIGTKWLEIHFLLQEADLHAQNPALLPDKLRQLSEARMLADKILSAGHCISLKTLAVNGSDLIAAGFPPGKSLGAALNALLNYVLEHPEENTRAGLLAQAAKMRDILCENEK